MCFCAGWKEQNTDSSRINNNPLFCHFCCFYCIQQHPTHISSSMIKLVMAAACITGKGQYAIQIFCGHICGNISDGKLIILSFISGCDKIHCLQHYFPIALDNVCNRVYQHFLWSWDKTGQLQTEWPAETNWGLTAISLAWTWFGYEKSDTDQETVLCKLCHKSGTQVELPRLYYIYLGVSGQSIAGNLQCSILNFNNNDTQCIAVWTKQCTGHSAVAVCRQAILLATI